MRRVARITAGSLFACLCFAQALPPPEFEVASIRPSNGTPEGQVQVGLHIDGAQVRLQFLTIRDYVAMAYRMNVSRISGPDALLNQRFDISATIPKGVETSQIPEMLQALLAARFQLKLHREKKEFPIYALLIGKPPLKVKESQPEPDAEKNEVKGTVNIAGGGSVAGVNVNLGHGSSWSFVPNRFEAKKLTMEQFAANLERFADRPIVDMTGLQGQYDLSFNINPEDYRPMLIRSAIAAGAVLRPQALRLLDDSSPAALGDAVAQTGLKLDARKAPLEVLVVDDVLKTPTAN